MLVTLKRVARDGSSNSPRGLECLDGVKYPGLYPITVKRLTNVSQNLSI